MAVVVVVVVVVVVDMASAAARTTDGELPELGDRTRPAGRAHSYSSYEYLYAVSTTVVFTKDESRFGDSQPLSGPRCARWG